MLIFYAYNRPLYKFIFITAIVPLAESKNKVIYHGSFITLKNFNHCKLRRRKIVKGEDFSVYIVNMTEQVKSVENKFYVNYNMHERR